ncbi:MAG: enoyl-CoA hydratase [Acidimicrobiales bacterium]|nr:enoyl-CoA hydratase [Acidimicrobiales bacterium]
MSQTDIDTGTQDLLAHIDGNVGAIVFNRPERRNALSNPMYEGFRRVLPRFAEDPEVRVVMITGSGGAFCAGGDVKGMHESNESGAPREGRPGTREGNIDVLRRNQRDVSLYIHKMQKPVVAAIPGAAAGAGLSIALAADIRLAAQRALVVSAFSGIGASGDFGGSWFLTQLVGHSKAKELYFMNPRLTAAEAHELGIVNKVLPDEGFEDAALAWCHELAARPPIAMRYIKENINRAIGSDLATCLDAEAVAMITTMSTEDHREAAAAFVEKRQATFNGR